ncbi:MAG: AmmeMemoRadiSam system protein A [Thermodesulfobacteriota bacterium]|nr:AmmeMemoRadiSam system protein A [Thermodesulfobacteriota bacterium]
MSKLTDEDRKSLLKLARTAIEAEINAGSKIRRPEKISSGLKEKMGCFVTLHKGGILRGCIGTIEPVRSLAFNVEENALNAAFHDPRFPAVEKDELSDIDIEISVLTVPKKVDFKDGDDLKKKLKPKNHGVILSQGYQSATFLPQVWEQLPDIEDFLEHLCQKGGMGGECWKDRETTVKVYEAEYFSES